LGPCLSTYAPTPSQPTTFLTSP
jgi:hypothetical protein